jgi:hypothetical protein
MGLRKSFERVAMLAFALVIVGGASSAWATTYYVATTGSDGGPGTQTAPFATIQKALNVVQAGDTCLINAGTYNESLTIVNTGSSTAPITIKSNNGAVVTVNSGSARALQVSGRKHYYTIDGLRFVSSHTVFDQWGEDFSVSLQGGIFDQNTDPTGGNNGYIIRNCYIEGAIYIYGHNNTVTNCELNGKTIWQDGIWDRDAPSHNNTYSNNKIHDYAARGVWSMQRTDSILIENNVIYNISNCGIDADGAAAPVYNTFIRGNTIYNVGGRGIECENGFNSIVEKNIVHDSKFYGIHYINYGPDVTGSTEYRTTNANGMIRNNLVYNIANAGIVFTGSPGNNVYNNTVYNVASSLGGIVTITYGGYTPNNMDIRNNIVSQCNPYAVYLSNGSSGLLNIQLSNNLYYNSSNTYTHYYQNIGTYTLAGFQSKTAQEQNSKFANPAFVSETTPDFSLTSVSPAIGAGITLAAVTDDINGVSRAKNDIGAYEFKAVVEVPSAPTNLTFQ